MAKTSKGGPTAGNRRQAVEALRAEQRAAERKKTLTIVGAAAAVGIVVIGAAAVPLVNDYRNDPARRSVSSFGVSAAAASCGAVIDDPATESGVHVGPGTNTPDQERVDYAMVPPSSGSHFIDPGPSGVTFYTVKDRLPMERYVHNLEHGWTILWYPADASKDEVADVKGLAAKLGASSDKRTVGKFLATVYDPSYGAFPAGKRFAVSHWGAKHGRRQLCGDLSGAAVNAFVTANPYTDSPEPTATGGSPL